MTAQRTDEEESTPPVGQEDPGADAAQDSTEMIDQGDAAPETSRAATATAVAMDPAEDAAAAPTDVLELDASSESGEAAGGSALGDAAALQDRAAEAVDTMSAAAVVGESAAVTTGSAESDTEPAGSAGSTETRSAVSDDTADDTAGADTRAAATDAAPAAEDATAQSDEAAALVGSATLDETGGGSGDTVVTPPAASDADGSETSLDNADAQVAPDELEAAPAAELAEPEEPPARVIDTRPEPTTMEELLNEQSGEIRSFKHGDVVEGNVVRIDKDEILVDIGAKSEGVVSNRELYGRHGEAQPQLNIGDTVLVYVLQPESNEGHAVLSLRRAGLERKWRAMQEQFDAGVIIEAPVIDHNKGGLIVDCGIRGFVPISQIVDFPRRPQNEQPRDAAQEIAEKLQPFVGRKLRLKILEVNRKANRLILSEKVALYEERREKRDELFSSLQVGQKVTGSVRSIAPFGVFVDLGGIDGLVHKSELSWNKVNNPEHGYKVGEEVEAEVIDINHERGRISLSIRRLQPDPWHSTVADLKVNDLIEGTVTKIVNFGAFVRVRDGLEGLIHISELSHQRVAHPGDVVHEGQRLKLKIISLDSERHRLGLSLKQAEEAPARPASEPRAERPRGRSERSYDPSQAVQEPEGGIDNTLAAAFAQVRQQVARSEQSRATPADDELEAAPRAEDVSDAADAELGAAVSTDDAETADAPAADLSLADEAADDADVTAGLAGLAETGLAAEAATADTRPEATADAAPADTRPEATAEAAVTDEAGTAETEAPTDASTSDANAADAAAAAAGTPETESTAEAEPAEASATVDTAAETDVTDETGLTARADAAGQAAAEGSASKSSADDESTALDQGAAAEEIAPVDESGISAGATEASSTGSDDAAPADEPTEGASDSAPAEGADREG